MGCMIAEAVLLNDWDSAEGFWETGFWETQAAPVLILCTQL